MTARFDVVVAGAGAAGMMCAIEAGKRGRSVAILERADRAGKKILISGGGRCNFTNLYCRAENFLSSNPHFVKSALARYGPADFVSLVERHGIAYHEKTLGQLFCDRAASQITGLLERECRDAGVRTFFHTNIEEIEKTDEYTVRCATQNFRARSVVIATGGLSIPKMGATAFGYDVARKFGLAIRETRPALVPLTLAAADRARYCDLAGVAMDVTASSGKHSFREKALITHRGLSGPAILQISSYWEPGEAIVLDLAPDGDVTKGLRRPHAARHLQAARAELRTILPQRLADRWIDLNPPRDWTNRGLDEWERGIHRWVLKPQGTEGYEKAEVTAGGVSTGELSAKTMECLRAPGLFFIGEVVDVTGHLGGFNFQWAWSSGFCAGQAV
ncbi:MAG TPA: NAD(P)/FAD-dependent oxidoreductase [Bryobacteraceae bacterium]|jgi:predicted Rossmann fold flavoprotein|nr:NAD(P)/FAD-dependent oxidoreductase [Bryobacteraceae bacterium]